MKQPQIFKLLTAMGLLAILGLQITQLLTPKQRRVGYIDNVRVYENFQLKKQLANQLDGFTSRQQHVLDSLNLLIETQVQELRRESTKLLDGGSPKLNALLAEMESTQTRFAEDRSRIIARYDEQVWTQLNQFVRDFGKEHQYDYIYGLSGDGSLMHAPESDDLTDEVLTYINTRYHGG